MTSWERTRACDQSPGRTLFSLILVSVVTWWSRCWTWCSLANLDHNCKTTPPGPTSCLGHRDICRASDPPPNVTHPYVGSAGFPSQTHPLFLKRMYCVWVTEVRKRFLPNCMVCCGCVFVNQTSTRVKNHKRDILTHWSSTLDNRGALYNAVTQALLLRMEICLGYVWKHLKVISFNHCNNWRGARMKNWSLTSPRRKNQGPSLKASYFHTAHSFFFVLQWGLKFKH